MEINESSRIYLKNYYVLEQARKETKQFLVDLALQYAAAVEEDIKSKDTSEISFHKSIQKDGGVVDFYYDNKNGMKDLESIGIWRYYISYIDALGSEDLTSSTKCRVFGYSPKNVGGQIRELKRMAEILKLPDPYRSIEIDLLEAPVDEVIVKLKNTFIEFHTEFLKIVEALKEEAKASKY